MQVRRVLIHKIALLCTLHKYTPYQFSKNAVKLPNIDYAQNIGFISINISGLIIMQAFIHCLGFSLLPKQSLPSAGRFYIPPRSLCEPTSPLQGRLLTTNSTATILYDICHSEGRKPRRILVHTLSESLCLRSFTSFRMTLSTHRSLLITTGNNSVYLYRFI